MAISKTYLSVVPSKIQYKYISSAMITAPIRHTLCDLGYDPMLVSGIDCLREHSNHAPLSIIESLVVAAQRPQFPDWAKSLKKSVFNGKLIDS